MNAPQQPTAELVAHELVTLARRFRNGAREVYASAELTFVEYSLLCIVADNPGISATAIAGTAHIDKSTASRQLGELRRRGFLTRKPEDAATRTQAIEITEAARDVLAQIQSRIATEITDRLRTWPKNDIDTFAALLSRYNEPVTPEHQTNPQSPAAPIHPSPDRA